jgi:septal ring factor EnvC (AmiA/AmiB activator)
MTMPPRERRKLEQELAELRRQIAAHKNELAIAVTVNKARRERLEWQITEREKRQAEIEARLPATDG